MFPYLTVILILNICEIASLYAIYIIAVLLLQKLRTNLYVNFY